MACYRRTHSELWPSAFEMDSIFKDTAIAAVAEALFADRKQHLLSLDVSVAKLDPKSQTAVLELVSQPSPWCLRQASQTQLKLAAIKLLEDLDVIGLLHDSARK